MAEQPQLSEIERATNIYNDIANQYSSEMSGNVNQRSGTSGYGYQINRTGATPKGFYGSYSTPQGNLITIGTPPSEGTVRGQSTDITGRGTGGSGYGQVSQMGASQESQKNYKPVEFKGPGKLDLPDYNPPDRNLAEERQLRREYMAPGLAQIRRTTQEAVISSKSMDNPNARALFINKALQGVGTALEKVTTGAGTQARAESMQRYSLELDKYYKGWKGKAEEAKLNWDADWNAAMADFNQIVNAQMGGMNVEGYNNNMAGSNRPRIMSGQWSYNPFA